MIDDAGWTRSWAAVGAHRLLVRTRVPEDGSEIDTPVLVVHGLGVSGRYLLPFGAALARRAKVVIPDLPGFGESSRPHRPLDVPALAQVLQGFVQTQIGGPVHVVANSFGCQIAAQLAAEFPDSVDSLSLVGPIVDRSQRSLVRLGLAWVRDALIEPPRVVVLNLLDGLRCPPLRFVRTARMSVRFQIEVALARVMAPVLLVRGSKDPLASPEWTRRLASVAGGATVEVVDGGHVVHAARPEAVADTVERFVALRHAPSS